MSDSITRRGLLATLPVACLTTSIASAAGRLGPQEPALPTGFPAQDPKLVRETVGASHANLAKVKELVGRSPALVNASWDWGYGDWETAIGACSHTGNREIAEFLLERGARPDIFTFVMLGDLEAVQRAVTAVPGLQRTPGPHGITMLAHAQAGGEEALDVLEYLKALGDADERAMSLEVSESEKAVYIGDYRFGEGDDGVMRVALDRRGDLTVNCGISTVRMHRVEVHGFAPVGAPAVRIRFKVEGEKAVALTLHDPEPIVKAVRTH